MVPPPIMLICGDGLQARSMCVHNSYSWDIVTAHGADRVRSASERFVMLQTCVLFQTCVLRQSCFSRTSDLSSLRPESYFSRVSSQTCVLFQLSSLRPVPYLSLVLTQTGVLSKPCFHSDPSLILALSSLRAVCSFRRVFTEVCMWFQTCLP